jgi:hypothetical protein
MNLASSNTYFHTKYSFSNLFIQFKWALDWAPNTVKCRGWRVSFSQTQCTVLSGWRVDW